MKKILVGTFIVVAGLFMFSATNVMAQLPCTADFDCDQDVDATDVGEFLNQFGRSPFNNPCPDCYDSPCPCSTQGCDPPAPVPKTGQTTSYITGDDGDLEKGVAWPNPRFTDNGDGTVTDNLTGLIWLKDANCMATNYPSFDNDGTAGDGAVTWSHAFSFISEINVGVFSNCGDGNTDWRLPNYKELLSLIDAENFFPALPTGHPFTNVAQLYYWSSTTLAALPGSLAWIVYIDGGGYVDSDYVTSWYYVWPVRGPE